MRGRQALPPDRLYPRHRPCPYPLRLGRSFWGVWGGGGPFAEPDELLGEHFQVLGGEREGGVRIQVSRGTDTRTHTRTLRCTLEGTSRGGGVQVPAYGRVGLPQVIPYNPI